MGIVPDESNLYDEMNGFDNLCFCASLYGMRKDAREKRASEMLEHFNLKSAGKRPFKAYSKGMRRKLAITAGIIHNPKMLFLDEPTTGIDHEVFWTREDRLVPMQTELLLKHRDQISSDLEEAMLRHYGEHAYHYGYFWWETPKKLPENFVYNKTRRWFATFNYINQFRGSALYLADSVDWLMTNQNADGLWDWGTQTKDPWGYFGYFSTTRNFRHNRVVDCTMEILYFLKKYLDNNTPIT